MSHVTELPAYGRNIEVKRITAAEASMVFRDLVERARSHNYAVLGENVVEIFVYRSEGQAAWARRNPLMHDRCGGAVKYVVGPGLPLEEVRRITLRVKAGD